MTSFFKRPKFYIPAAIVALVLVIILISGGDNGAQTESLATKKDIADKVSVTGRVRSMSDVDLAFDRAGRISNVLKDVGDRVYPGEVLAVLENGELAANLAQAEANVRVAQAKLDELKQGSTVEEIAVKQVAVTKNQTSLLNAKRSAVDTLQEVYTNFDDAIRNTADKFFSNPRSSNPQLNIVVDSNTKTNIEQGRVAVEEIFTTWSVSGVLPEDIKPGAPVFATAKTNLTKAKTLLDFLAFAVNSLTPSSGVSQTTIDGYKTSVAAARTQINNAISDLTGAEEAVKTAQSGLEVAQSELALSSAPTRPESINAQEAQVDAARANADSLRAQLAKTYIRSPIVGIVTERNVDVGEIVAANTTAISVISDQEFKIEANITESDIAKVTVGDIAVLSLDAYPDATLSAKVVAIDPAETLIDGVPAYKTTLHLTEKDSRIKSGMTANLDILTTQISGAIVVPSRAVFEEEGKKFVWVKNGKEEQKTEVTTGIRDGEGGVQILTGIIEGQTVLVK